MIPRHTPGPWKPEYRERTLSVYQCTRSGKSAGRPICTVARADVHNANVLAAAPDLLLLVKEFVSLYDDVKDIVNSDIKAKLARAGAAIDKAEGR